MLVAVAAAVVAWSYIHALLAPGTDSVAVRSVEWIRDHGGNSLVNRVERIYYTWNPPPLGGTPKGGIPTQPAAPATTAPPAPASTLPAHLTRPENIALPAAGTLPNEGVWQTAGRPVKGLPAVYTAFLRPDAVHTSLVAGLAWMDTRLLRAVYVPGLSEPGGGTSAWKAQIPSGERGSAIAAFNSGFKMSQSRSGVYFDGRALVPLTDGAASLVITDDGTATVGQWGRDLRMAPNVIAVRQNLSLIVDNATPVTGLTSDTNSRWGTTVGNNVFVWRSGVGVTAEGALVYAAGNGLSVQTLAHLLAVAGCRRAMELDINSAWVSYYLYTNPTRTDPANVAGSKLLPDMRKPGDRYLTPGARDFFTLLAHN